MKTLTAFKMALCASLLTCVASQASVIASFDDLTLPPALDSSTGLQFTNSNNLVYQGITWDDRFSVVGDQYRVDAPSGPLFGLPHSGHYFVTNQGGGSGLLVTTDKILTGAWFGRNEYYGFGAGGSDQISIYALSGVTELASVVFDLPENFSGQPEPLSFVDTQSFAALTGITGYRIDRRELGSSAGNWVADDFQFSDVADVPELGSALLLAPALAFLLLSTRLQRLKPQPLTR
ncbi:MAG: hypothetical protein NTV43_16470 [Methylococcales bacterium]|nr:hypothetical protein [Methylococcales bacterium]